MILKAGVACVGLPYWPGLNLAGYIARDNPCTGVHDPLYARALALCDNGRPLLILVADCLGYESNLVADVRQRLPQADVFLAATHTHSAPASQALRGCGTPDPAWQAEMSTALVEAGQAALAALCLAHLKFGVAAASGIATNRRQPDSEQMVQEPLDPDVSTLLVMREDGSTLATLVHFTCHPVVLDGDNLLVSAEWPGLVCQHLTERTGAPTLFVNGAAGDINPLRRGSWDGVEELAAEVARAANEAARNAVPLEDNPLAYAEEVLHWPYLPLPSHSELESLAAEYSTQLGEAQVSGSSRERRVYQAHLEWARQALQHGGTSALDAPIVLAGIGDLVLVGVPGELFVELGIAIKQDLRRAGYRHALVCGYTNENVGYIPTRSAYSIGGYEVEEAHKYYGQPSALAPEAGEMLVARSIELGGKLRAATSTDTS